MKNTFGYAYLGTMLIVLLLLAASVAPKTDLSVADEICVPRSMLNRVN